jgi:Sulfotransferase family
VLVTGLPRSGTTWLARELARAPGVALAGREPMNPRGKQFALGGSLSAWTRLGQDTAPETQRLIRRVYRGWEPRVYSRYGVRQWSAPLPRTRLVIKDPFALLSLPFVVDLTGAVAVVLFRHPAALLQSYRRMGWSPALAEAQALGLSSPHQTAPPPFDDDPVGAMAWFWSACYEQVLDDLDGVTGSVVVDHAELSDAGESGVVRVGEACGMGAAHLRPPHTGRIEALASAARRVRRKKPPLHNFERTAEEVARGWRSSLVDGEAERMEALTAQTWSSLRARRLRFDGARSDNYQQKAADG